MDPTEIPEELLRWIDQKCAGYTPRRNSSKTTATERARLIFLVGHRLMEVRQKCFEATDQEVRDIMMKNVGKPERELQNSIHIHNLKKHGETDKQRAVAEATARTQADANQQLVHANNQLSHAHQQVIEQLIAVVPQLAITHETAKPNGHATEPTNNTEGH